MKFSRLFHTLSWITRHPLNSGRKFQALSRWLRWQIGSRLVPGPVVIPFVDQTRYIAHPGMTGATGNHYAGLIEYEEMGFVLHFLRPDDHFVDVGANVGMFTILAAGAVGARVTAFEPAARTFQHLEENVRINRLENQVQLHRAGVGDAPGTLRLSSHLDQTNRMLAASEGNMPSEEVEVMTLDEGLSDPAHFLKVDVEGFEPAVFAGARQCLADPSLRGMIVELKGYGAQYGFDEQDLWRIIIDEGFVPVSYDPGSRTLQRLSTDHIPSHGNGLFVRDYEEASQRLRDAPRFDVAGRPL
ncbi:MAG: FkbM family methyltransferase [Gammaproteobacteria bacterium]